MSNELVQLIYRENITAANALHNARRALVESVKSVEDAHIYRVEYRFYEWDNWKVVLRKLPFTLNEAREYIKKYQGVGHYRILDINGEVVV